MIVFPNAKINLGLNIVAKRNDGFHDIESVFYPIPLSDILEIIESDSPNNIEFSTSGVFIPGDSQKNLCVKAYNLLIKELGDLKGIKCHLHKIIPIGAGLGGGSSDGAFFLKTLNELLQLKLNKMELESFAAKLGSDCTFFVENKPSYVTGTGNKMESLALDLSGYFILIVDPKLHVNTREAYSSLLDYQGKGELKDAILSFPIEKWNNTISNNFEKSIFKKYPELIKIKEMLYKHGAIYASMTGSGSSFYGLFKTKIKTIPSFFSNFNCWQFNLSI